MLQPNPSKRLTTSEIMDHPWMHGAIPSKDDLLIEMEERQKIIKSQMKQDSVMMREELSDIETGKGFDITDKSNQNKESKTCTIF